MKRSLVASAFMMVFAAQSAFAAHPLVTDDAGTVGAKVQIEVTGEVTRDNERVHSEDAGADITVKGRGGTIAATATVGFHERVDFVLGIPYQWNATYEDGVRTARAGGLSDISLDLKWRFFEQDGWSFAVKPGLSLPTGDDDRGLGAGRATYRAYLIGTKELAPFAFHANLGYIRNENKVDERKNLWHASLAAEFEFMKSLKAVADFGVERNSDKASSTNPAFALAGLIWQINDTFSIDGGVKFGLNKPETDTTYLFGIAMKF
jgi:hypothetical protein